MGGGAGNREQKSKRGTDAVIRWPPSLITEVRALESNQDEAIAAFAKAWIHMVETRPHISQLVAVTDAAWNVTQGSQSSSSMERTRIIISILGQTLLVPGSKPLHQPIHSLLKRLPCLDELASHLSHLLLELPPRLDDATAGLPAALVSCLGSPALRPHLKLDPGTFLPCLCELLRRALGTTVSQASLELLLDCISSMHSLLLHGSERPDKSLLEMVSDCLTSVLVSGIQEREVLCAASSTLYVSSSLLFDNANLSARFWAISLGFLTEDKDSESLVIIKPPQLQHRLQVLARLCACRGIMEAASAEVLLEDLGRADGDDNQQHPWQLLVSGGLPFLTEQLRSASDAPSRYLAVAAVKACMLRLKKLWDVHEDLGPPLALTEDFTHSLLRTLWSCWEDPMRQVTKEAHTIFAALLDVLALQATAGAAPDPARLLQGVVQDLLDQGPEKKGRYAPLAALVTRLGPAQILQLRPHLVQESLGTLDSNRLCTAVSGLMRALWTAMKKECTETWTNLEAVAAVLTDASHPALETLQENIGAHILPVILEVGGAPALDALLEALGAQGKRTAANVSSETCHDDAQSSPQVNDECLLGAQLTVLSAGQAAALLDWEQEACDSEAQAAGMLESLVNHAIFSRSEVQRLAAATLVCIHPKSLRPLTDVQTQIVFKWAEIEMRCDSVSHQEKVLRLLGKLASRIHAVVAARIKSGPAKNDEHIEIMSRLAGQMFELARKGLSGGATHTRKTMSLRLLQLLLEKFSSLWTQDLRKGELTGRASSAIGGVQRCLTLGEFNPLPPEFLSSSTVHDLIWCCIDSWDANREAAIACIRCFPYPLPRAEKTSLSKSSDVVERSFALTRSRMEERAEAGARLLGLWMSKEPWSGLVWTFDGNGRPLLASREHTLRMARHYWGSEILQQALIMAQEALAQAEDQDDEAWNDGLLQKPFLIIRHLVPHLPWNSGDEHVQTDVLRVSRLLHSMVLDCLALTSSILSRPQDHGVGAEGVVDSSETSVLEEWASELALDRRQAGRPQLIMRAAWGSCREAVLLWKTLAKWLVLQSSSNAQDGDSSEQALACAGREQLQSMGDTLVEQLCHLKHNGAVEKCSATLMAVTSRALRSSVPDLQVLPRAWLDRVFDFMARPGQGLSDIVRRSAGLPAGILAVLSCDAPKPALRELLVHAVPRLLQLSNPGNRDAAASSRPARVHSLNTLRLLCSSSELAEGMAPHLPAATEACLVALSSPRWEVRNAAMLCYAALLTRLLGYRNDASQEASGARLGVTASDFFGRFPSLLPLLLRHVQAVDQGNLGSTEFVHSNVFPVLALLARLRPCIGSGNIVTDGTSAGKAFLPFVQACSAAPQLAVRELASKAVIALLLPSEIGFYIASIASGVEQWLTGGNQDSNHNWVHGMLLQLQELLPAGLQSYSSLSAEEMIWLSTTVVSLRSCVSYLIKKELVCPPLTHAFLGVALGVLPYGQAGECSINDSELLEGFILQVSKACQTLLQCGLSNQDWQAALARRPMGVSLLQSAAKLAFSGRTETISGLQIQALTSSLPEIAAVAARDLLAREPLQSKVDLLPIAKGQWHQETKIPMLQLALRQTGWGEELWYLAAEGSDAQRAAVLRAIVASSTGRAKSIQSKSIMRAAVQAIRACSEPTRLEDLRAAAAKALCCVPSALSSHDWWTLTLTLLQDDEPAVRRHAAVAAANVIEDSELATKCDPWVLDCFVRCAGQRCSNQPHLLLAHWIWDSDETEAFIQTQPPDPDDENDDDDYLNHKNAGRVYKVDPDGLYADPLHVAWLARECMWNLPPPQEPEASILASWTSKAGAMIHKVEDKWPTKNDAQLVALQRAMLASTVLDEKTYE